MRRIFWVLLFVGSYVICNAQGTDVIDSSYQYADSIGIGIDNIEENERFLQYYPVNNIKGLFLKNDYSSYMMNKSEVQPDLKWEKLNFLEKKNPTKVSVEPGITFFSISRSGSIFVSGSASSMPGLMEIHRGNIGYGQEIGKFSFYVGGEANKYGYFNGLHTQYGINGAIQYNVSSKLSLTGYATYYLGNPPMMRNGMPMPPAMMGAYDVSVFGGTVNFQFNETFGLIVGGQAVQQFGTNRYKFEPIASPTIKVGKVRFTLPVGQILYDYVRSEIERKRQFKPRK